MVATTEVDREALAKMTADEVITSLASTEDLEFLDNLAAAEQDGENRTTVVEAIRTRQAEIQGGEVAPDELPGEQTEWDDAPVDEILPVIYSGYWARIKGTATKVPAHARGRDVAVMDAIVRRAGNNTITNGNYDYQLPTDSFSVRLIDTGEEFDCTRSAFLAFGPDRGALHENSIEASK